MKKFTAILLISAMLISLLGCNDSSKAKGDVSEDNGIASSIDVEVGN